MCNDWNKFMDIISVLLFLFSMAYIQLFLSAMKAKKNNNIFPTPKRGKGKQHIFYAEWQNSAKQENHFHYRATMIAVSTLGHSDCFPFINEFKRFHTIPLNKHISRCLKSQLTYWQPAQNGVLTDLVCQAILV